MSQPALRDGSRTGPRQAATAALRRRGEGSGATIGRPVIALALVADLVAAVALSLLAFSDARAVVLAVFDMDQSAGSDRGVNLTEVARHPEVMVGRTVTISGRVVEASDGQTVTIGTTAPFVGDTVAIVSPGGLSALLSKDRGARLDEGDVLRVTGEVRLREAARAEFGLTLPEADQGGGGIIVAESIEVDPQFVDGTGDKEFPFSSDGYDLGLTVYDIVHDTDDYLGMTVTVSGEIEEGLLTGHAFRIGDDGVLVITGERDPDVFVEATAYVTGTVRRFDRAALEAELGIELDDRLGVREGEPTIVAETVEVVA